MELPAHHTDWLLGLLLLGVGLALAARLYNPERFKDFISLPFHIKRDEMELGFKPLVARGLFDVSLSVLSYLMLSLGIYIWLHHGWEGAPLFNDKALYFRILFILVVFFLLKNLGGLFVGWVFDCTEDIARSQNSQLAHRAWLSLAIIPALVLAVFNSDNYRVWYLMVLIILVLGVALSIYFSFVQLWRLMAPMYYKIFYLCALEITPLLFLVGWLKSLNQ
jgi:hypothetical protein